MRTKTPIRRTLALVPLFTLSLVANAKSHASPAGRLQPGLPGVAASPLNSFIQKKVDGIWLGAIEVSGFKLRLALKITRRADGTLTAKLDSIDQGANDLPIDTITLEGETVRFQASTLGLSFEGKLNSDSSELSGQLKQGPASHPVIFKRTDRPPTLNRPQDPQKPYPYAAEEVSYENKTDKVKLAGTLTLPNSKRPVPAVVLITGSGPEDRNETVFGHRPFLVIADYLTRRGIAVLRVDDRGVGGTSPGSPETDTSENFVADVLTGVAFLKNRKEINPRQIGLIGHSEGGMIAPLAAVKSKDVAFIVLLAGPGQKGADVVLAQGDLLLKASGADAETIRQTRIVFSKIFVILQNEKDNLAAEKQIREMVAAQVAGMTGDQKKTFAPVVSTIDSQMPLYSSAWFRYFLSYDPAPTLRRVRIPVLALVGEKDLQVPPQENLRLIKASLKTGGNRDYTALVLPGLNHLFQHTNGTGSPSEYGAIDETISADALQTMSDWILRHTSVAARATTGKRARK
ncbi:MAG TPA: alpha/beta hydrolase [Blastocatellia bacterium]|nr:alpha/beta hydrolase [Blastocatellia bacterium]HAF23054.1 alpha/beta hydrolase [Blastocatellia bacterium]HCX28211.1 alpha/beta hydrolase [Blastocatellia bacterium]